MAGMTTGGTTAFDALALQETIRESVATSALSAGMTLYSQKKYTQAAQAFKQASAMNPALAQAYTYLGYTQIQQGKQQDAVKSLALSLKVDKTQDQVYTDLANLQIDMKKTADAEKTLQSAIKQNNQNTLAYYTLGQLQAQQGDYVGAEKQFRQVIKLEPKDANGYYALGMALDGQKRYGEGIAQLNKATSMKKNFVAAISELGSAYAATGDNDNAKNQVDRLNKIATADATLAAQNLSKQLQTTGISYFDLSGAKTYTTSPTTGQQIIQTEPLNPYFPQMNVKSIDTAPTGSPDPYADPLYTAGGARVFTLKIAFTNDMNAASVTNTANWSVSKASANIGGGTYGGLYSPQSITIPVIPDQVTYDPVNRVASLVITLHQNATVNGTIDPSHLVFKFNGVDQNGQTLDPTADQIDGATGPF